MRINLSMGNISYSIVTVRRKSNKRSQNFKPKEQQFSCWKDTMTTEICEQTVRTALSALLTTITTDNPIKAQAHDKQASTAYIHIYVIRALRLSILFTNCLFGGLPKLNRHIPLFFIHFFYKGAMFNLTMLTTILDLWMKSHPISE